MTHRGKSTAFNVLWVCILTAGVFLRVVLALSHRVGYGALGYDHLLYENLAANLAQGFGFVLQPGGAPTFMRPPGYPLFLAAVHAITGPGILGVQLAQIGMWAILPLLAAWLLRPYGRTAVLIALLILSLDPFWVIIPLTGLTETLSAVLVMGSVCFAVKAEHSTKRVACGVMAGVLLGLGALTRVNLLIAVPALAWAVARGPAGRQAALALVAAAAVVFSPWLVRNAALGYLGVSTVSGVNKTAMAVHYNILPPEEMDAAFDPAFGLRTSFPDLAIFRQPGVASELWEPFQNGAYMDRTGLSEVEIDRLFSAAASHAVRSHPLRYVAAIALNVWNFATSYFERRVGLVGTVYRLASLVLMILAAIGTVAWRRQSDSALIWGTAAIIVCSAVGMAAVTLVYYRYRLPLAPLVATLAALGFSRSAGWFVERWRSSRSS